MPILIFILFYGYLKSLRLSRNFEYIADAEAVNLTGDPIAYIKSLNKITSLNLIAKNWSKAEEKLKTHPATFRRINAIARDHNISDRQVLEILKTFELDAPYYTLPSFNPNKVFSTSFKQNITIRKSCAIATLKIFIPTIIAFGVQSFVLSQNLCYLAGLILTFAIFLKSIQSISRWGEDELRRKLKVKFKKRGFPVDKYQGIFVGFSPASQPRVYDRFPSWDMGFLFIMGDRLCYVGEESRFSLSRKQIIAIELGMGIPSWYNSTRIYISCYEAGTNTISTFNLTTIEIYSLHKQLQNWWRLSKHTKINPYPFSPPIFKNLPAPKIATVTSNSPQDELKNKKILDRIICLCFLSVTVGLVFNLSYLGIVYIITVACLTTILELIPYYFIKINR